MSICLLLVLCLKKGGKREYTHFLIRGRALPRSACRGRHCLVSVLLIYTKKDGGEELWRLRRLSCWQSEQQQRGTQSPWTGAGGYGGHRRTSRPRITSEPADTSLHVLEPSRAVPSRAERSHENKSDMNGEIVCNSHSVTVLSCTNCISPVHDEIKLTQQGRCSPICFQQINAPRQGEGRRTNPISTTAKHSKTHFPEMESSYSQCSPCWSDEQPSPPQLHCAQNCLRPPTELPLRDSLSHAPLLANNNGSSRLSHQRRGVRLKPKGKKSTLRPAGGKNSQNRKVTDYYPIRRSSRKSKTEIECEEKKLIDDLITKGIEEGMEVRHIEGKGRAVFATRCFQKGEYVVEYHGDLLQITDAKKREAEYAQNPATGCYMYYFQHLCKTYCVDATKETGRMGRLINHSKNGNCQTKLHDISGVPHLILVASRDVDEGEELLYDYGDRSKASIAAHPWLKY
ncbi:LOW QUALITY PROTEIN: N-lysine methyltransferase KMT5A-A [Etheostoma spectabile]|uniref:LOW QUALITY PROTEIN: N-lysine methyltransferase KMT5A-A n=1 Tax=Etheostoma spectabile TaxID=54343 RepID=UPI0013AFAE8F|nr:LOW QUALITY PROTEIN: N-lysine methyltransferase KMT5A-A-like [Etheostoma spectabile]